MPLIPAKASLTVSDPSGVEQISFLLDQESCVVGRRDPHRGNFPEIDLSPLDLRNSVSRCHARFYCQGDQFFLEDLGSFNGTYLIEGEKESKIVPKEPRLMQNGNEVFFGGLKGRFDVSENLPQTAPA